MPRAGFAYYAIDGELRMLMTADQLTTFLAEHGIALPSLADVQIAGRYRGAALYCPRDALEFCEANA